VDSEINRLFTEQYESNWYLKSRAEVLAAIIRPLCGVGCRLVDVGAGTGAILARVATKVAIAIEGDLNLARVGRSGHRLPFLVADLSSGIPLSGQTADVVLSLDVFEHLVDDRAAMAEVFRILRPGGCLVVSVPAFQSLWSRHDDLHHHKRRYSKQALLDALAATGFACTRVTYFNSLLFPIVWASRKLEGITRPSANDYEKPHRLLARALGRIFRFEARIIPRWNLPVGVSLLAIATRP